MANKEIVQVWLIWGPNEVDDSDESAHTKSWVPEAGSESDNLVSVEWFSTVPRKF